ncbi:MAG: SufD family Fe-S cluster assembly protein [Peptococcaceae bacterium]|nr:SufD family Fe-S cluster assembly protein [Peptococcaceae bacterium]
MRDHITTLTDIALPSLVLNSPLMDNSDLDRLLSVGVDAHCRERSGSFVQVDHQVLHAGAAEPGLEVLSTPEALKRYDWLKDYWWQIVPAGKDEFTKYAQDHTHNGYFIRALPGAKINYPLQACLYLAREGLTQCVHNIVIVEEGAELNIITGCASGTKAKSGAHIGISEFYVRKGAKLNFTMIHSWAEDVEVRPRTGTVVEEGGTFISNYICTHPVRLLQMYPVSYLRGEGAVARYQSILVAPPGSKMDVGSRVVLDAPATKSEIITRTVTTGGKIISRGHPVGQVPGVKAHLECRGLMLAPQGLIHAIPELEARAEGVELSHEAAVGKIAHEEIEYLMARGLSEEDAVSTIVRGFLNVDIPGLPPALRDEIDRAVSATREQGA